MTKKAGIMMLVTVLLATFTINIQAARPTVKITAAPTTIVVGSSSTLTWTSTGATSASINNNIGSVPVNGSKVVTPAKTTTYTITARNSSGSTTSSVTVTVKAAPPTVTFSAAPTSIAPGGSSTLSWTTTNATSASIDQNIGTVALNGSKVVKPTTTKTYTITVKGSGGTVTAKATVTVVVPPPTVSFSALPVTIPPGSSATLSWTTTNATSASIDQGIGTVALNGSKTVTPAATKTYTITVIGSGGTVTAQATVTVAVPPPTVTISAEPTIIQPGESSTLTWTSTNATSATIDNEIGDVDLNGSLTVSPALTTTYTITVSNGSETATAAVTVTVNQPQPQVILKAFPMAVLPGESTVLCWQTINVDSTTIDNGVGDVPANGSIQVSPAITTTYTITATGPGGTTNATVTVSIDDTLQPSVAIYSSLEIVASGGEIVLSWNALHAESTSIDNGIGSVQAKGSLRVTPGQSTTYTISADNRNGTATAAVEVELKSSPRCYTYIPDYDPNIINIVDNDHIELGKRIALECYMSDSAVAKDGMHVYVGSSQGILVIDTASNSVVSTIAAGTHSTYLALHPSGKLLCAAGNDESGVVIAMINTETGQVIKELHLNDVHDYLHGITFHPDGSRLYVVISHPIGESSKVLAIDTASNEIMLYIPLKMDWDLASDLAISPDGSRLYMIRNSYDDGYDDNLFIIDTITNEILKKLTINFQYMGKRVRLRKIAMMPDGSRLYLIAYDENSGKTIFYMDTATFDESQINSVVLYPESLAVHPDGSRLFVVKSNGLASFNTSDNTWERSVSLSNGTHRAYGNFVGYIADTVSGKVTQNNVGVEGVTLTISGEGLTKTALTDAGGNYVVALKNGTYNVTPSKDSMVFSPQSLQVTINRSAIGQDFKVIDINVPPTVTLKITPTYIIIGSSSTLSWTSTNTVTASIDNGVGNVPINGSITVTPTATTTYKITVSNTVLIATAMAKVIVTGSLPTVSITASPATINSGESSTLTWTSTSAASASIDNGIGTVPVNGSKVVTPAATTTYKITVTGPGGSANASATVGINEPLPTVTITAVPDAIPPGGSATLTWTTTNATSAAIDQGIGLVQLNSSLEVKPAVETIYTITAIGPGGTATASVTVKMLDALLRNVWNGMKTAMINGNVDQAASYFCEKTREAYKEVYTDLLTQLPQIAQEMGEMEFLAYKENMVIYRIKRNDIIQGEEQEISYRIFFVFQNDQWLIYKY